MTSTIEMLDTREIIPGPNDRTIFDKSALKELAANISEHGLIQPITVRWVDDAGAYQIVAGERRYRACAELLGWLEIPAIVKDLDDKEASAIMLAENIARENLDPIDEARAYASRMNRYGLTADEIAQQVGVSTIRIRFRLKLLWLRDDVQKLIRSGNLSIGYAQILADADLDPNRQLLAIGKLRDNPRATPAWFRRIVNELLQQQAQGELFEMPLFGGPQLGATTEPVVTTPPTPGDTVPPVSGHTPREIVAGQSTFWSEAAAAWDSLGKPFKRQECEAAAKALQLALSAM